MRAIKFRGKSTKTGEWIYGYYVAGNGIKSELHTITQDGVVYYVHPKTVGQFIGLKDKHGTEIYEGDVVNYEDYAPEYEDGFLNVGVVEYCVDGCFFTVSGRTTVDSDAVLCSGNDYLAVLGNIHENSELIAP